MQVETVLRAAVNSAPTAQGKSMVEDIILAQVSNQWTVPTNEDEIHAFADWNKISEYNQETNRHRRRTVDNTPARVLRILEAKGIDCEWEDEWSACDECGRMVRTSPDCYQWKGFYDLGDGYLVCGHCIDAEDYLAERINNPNKAVNTDLVNPLEHGFELMNGTFENGFHSGQTDNPTEILAEYQTKYPEYEFVFDYEPSQFYVEFRLFGRQTEDSSNETRKV